MVEEPQRVGQQADEREGAKHDVELEAPCVCGAAVWRAQRDARDADHDRRHREVLDAAGALTKHALARHHQHEQAGRERGLHDHQRRKFERDDLQRPAKQRERRPEQPTLAAYQPRDEREPQVGVGWRLLRVHRLEGDPYAVEARGPDRREQAQDEIDHERR